MSHLVLTAAFGSAQRFHAGPKHVRVFGQLLVGGSGLYLFHDLDSGGGPIRIRTEVESVAAALMAGFVLTERDLRLGGEAGRLAERQRSEADKAGEVELSPAQVSLLSEAAAEFDVAVLLTYNGAPSDIEDEDFLGWPVQIAMSTS